MPQAANIVINDGQGSPVAHTFNYAPLPNNISSWEDRVGGVLVGYNSITMSYNRPKSNTTSKTVGNRYYNAVIKLRVPTLETLGTADNGFTPPPTVAYNTMCEMRFALPERANLQNRKDILAFAKNLLSNAFVTALIENGDTAW